MFAWIPCNRSVIREIRHPNFGTEAAPIIMQFAISQLERERERGREREGERMNQFDDSLRQEMSNLIKVGFLIKVYLAVNQNSELTSNRNSSA